MTQLLSDSLSAKRKELLAKVRDLQATVEQQRQHTAIDANEIKTLKEKNIKLSRDIKNLKDDSLKKQNLFSFKNVED